ncbi:hypothetical protein CRYUN_Cryun08bG0083200 [Craigia yunnanensis]
MESYTENQDTHVLAYIHELMTMIRASQERMQTLEENNKQMIETIFKFASSTTTSQVQLTNFNGCGNTFDIDILSMTNISCRCHILSGLLCLFSVCRVSSSFVSRFEFGRRTSYVYVFIYFIEFLSCFVLIFVPLLLVFKMSFRLKFHFV